MTYLAVISLEAHASSQCLMRQVLKGRCAVTSIALPRVPSCRYTRITPQLYCNKISWRPQNLPVHEPGPEIGSCNLGSAALDCLLCLQSACCKLKQHQVQKHFRQRPVFGGALRAIAAAPA